MKADLTRQWRLLDLQKLDTRLDQLAHRERTMPVLTRLADAEKRRSSLEEEVVLARTAVGDVDREISKADQDVQLVRDRAARNTQRLDSGQGSAKELQAMQHEQQALARRQSELEDVELEVMERAESLRADLGVKETSLSDAEGDVRDLGAERDEALQQIERERSQVQRDREQLAPGLGEDLLGLYERVRAQHGGVGAAALLQRRCDGCHLELTPADLTAIRNAPEDEVLRHEECGRILVRTAESGL
nr:C4-type zinc ribbon domain-containing protein [Barrientosiimonas endolithica]